VGSRSLRGERDLEASLLLFGELGRLVERDEDVAALLQGLELLRNVDAVPVHEDRLGHGILSFLHVFEERVEHASLSDTAQCGCVISLEIEQAARPAGFGGRLGT
jgi:hypothetical protein